MKKSKHHTATQLSAFNNNRLIRNIPDRLESRYNEEYFYKALESELLRRIDVDLTILDELAKLKVRSNEKE